jgi:hypothetical protein
VAPSPEAAGWRASAPVRGRSPGTGLSGGR